jgi:hypothetical protein
VHRVSLGGASDLVQGFGFWNNHSYVIVIQVSQQVPTYGYRLKEIAEYFGIYRTTVSKGIEKTEVCKK